MAANNPQVPNLSSVLKTLASLAPHSEQSVVSHHQQTQNLVAQQWQHPQKQPNAVRPDAAIKPRIIDPATIIDWPSGLKCVMKTVASHDNVIKEIRRVRTQYSGSGLYSLRIDDYSST
jgi:hypothetical protein